MYLTVGALILALAGMVAYRLLGTSSRRETAARARIQADTPKGQGETPDRGDRKVKVRIVMMVVVTVLVLVSGLYIILSQEYDDGTQKWAFASIGAIIGFWLNKETS
jgi:hypothetical protein